MVRTYWNRPLNNEIKLKLVINQLQTTVFHLCENEQDTISFWDLHSLIRIIFWIDIYIYIHIHTHVHTHTHTYICIYIYMCVCVCNLNHSRHNLWNTKRVTIFQVTFESSSLPLFVYFVIWIVVYFCFGSPVDVTLTWRLAKTLSVILLSLIGKHFYLIF